MTADNPNSVPKRSFSPESYLTSHILVGLILLLLLCCGIFATLANSISANNSFVQFDIVIDNAIHANANPSLIPIMLLFSVAGYELTLAITAILVVYFVWKRRWPDVALFVLAVVGVQILEELIKPVFHRNRPIFVNPMTIASGYSFPSGHAMGAMAFYGLVAYLLIRRETGWLHQVLIAGTALLIILLIGFSRIYLGLHYPSDVAGGYAAGLAWLILTILIVDVFRKWRLKRQKLTPSVAIAGGSK